nr:hypothetical protein CFP56_63516 [Quercus suber]
MKHLMAKTGHAMSAKTPARSPRNSLLSVGSSATAGEKELLMPGATIHSPISNAVYCTTAVLTFVTSGHHPRQFPNRYRPLVRMSELTAAYESPSSQHAFSLPLSRQLAPSSVEAKTKSLSTLRASLSTLQSEVNTFLTQRMDDSKIIANENMKGSRCNDERAEQMYGEEDGADDEG